MLSPPRRLLYHRGSPPCSLQPPQPAVRASGPVHLAVPCPAVPSAPHQVLLSGVTGPNSGRATSSGRRLSGVASVTRRESCCTSTPTCEGQQGRDSDKEARGGAGEQLVAVSTLGGHVSVAGRSTDLLSCGGLQLRRNGYAYLHGTAIVAELSQWGRRGGGGKRFGLPRI